MFDRFFKNALVAGLLISIAAVPVPMLAQSTNKPPKAPDETKQPAKSKKKDAAKGEKKPAGHPFHGKLAAVDKFAKTITIGESTYQITSETKIKKAGKPATLEDGVVGEECSGYAKPDAEGKKMATTLNFGPNPETKGKKKGSEKAPANKSEKSEKATK